MGPIAAPNRPHERKPPRDRPGASDTGHHRSGFTPRGSAKDDESPTIEFGEVRVDHLRHLVERKGQPVHLTPLEYRLLAMLIASAGRILTHRRMLREVRGADHVESNPYLRVYVGNLRRKLEADPSRPRHILTETGIGYRFVR